MSIQAAQQAMREGRLPDARRHLEAIIQRSPASPEVHYNLAMVLARLEDFAAAAAQFEHCLEQAPDNADLLNNLGNALRLSGQFKKARLILDRAVNMTPAHTALRCNRGWLHLSMKNPAAAVADFRRALQTSAAIEDAWLGMVKAQLAAGDFEQAADAAADAVRHFPRSAALHNARGVAQVKQREPQAALDCFQQAIKLHPGNVEALTNLGITAEHLGNLELAERSLQAALEVRPDYHVAHFHLAHLATHTSTVAELKALESARARASENEVIIDLEFALGKALARLGRHEQAFPHFLAARERLHRQQPFDLDATLEKLLPSANPAPEIPPRTRARLIFVVGMPRSGTTLVDQILSAHSRVVSLGEAHTALKLEKRLAVGTPGSQPTRAGEEAARGELAQWLRQQMKPPQDGLSVVDTSPGRFTQLGLLAELLPEAVFVHCTRHPLDTCVSIFEHPLSDAHGYANSLADLGCYYRAYQRLMAHWQAALGERFLEINYESLVSAPDTEIARLLAHCDLEFEDDCTRFYGHSRPVLTASAAQVRQPINTRSVGRWRTYERFLKPLLDQLSAP